MKIDRSPSASLNKYIYSKLRKGDRVGALFYLKRETQVVSTRVCTMTGTINLPDVR